MARTRLNRPRIARVPKSFGLFLRSLAACLISVLKNADSMASRRKKSAFDYCWLIFVDRRCSRVTYVHRRTSLSCGAHSGRRTSLKTQALHRSLRLDQEL